MQITHRDSEGVIAKRSKLINLYAHDKIEQPSYFSTQKKAATEHVSYWTCLASKTWPLLIKHSFNTSKCNLIAVNSTFVVQSIVYDACQLGKLTQLSFSDSVKIHCDLWGLAPKTFGNKYISTMLVLYFLILCVYILCAKILISTTVLWYLGNLWKRQVSG